MNTRVYFATHVGDAECRLRKWWLPQAQEASRLESLWGALDYVLLVAGLVVICSYELKSRTRGCGFHWTA